LELHEKYKDNCFIVWSITTCNEKIRRLVEPGTPPAVSMFKLIKKFIDAGVCCGVNIDPILPLITDSKEEIELILDSCVRAEVKYVFGAVLRLRDDIWQRMRTILKSLDLKVGIDEYKRIYQFTEPIKTGYNLATNQVYSKKVMHDLEEKILERGMLPCFPDHIKTKAIERRFVSGGNGARSQQLTLLKYL
jgi:DNA repair photolyase